jgi:hypothetical protein
MPVPPRGLPPGVMWDKSRAQQASCLLNKPSTWHVLMGLHCLINLKLFFLQLFLSATSFLPSADSKAVCRRLRKHFLTQSHTLCSNPAGQPDRQAGWPEGRTILGLPDRYMNEFTFCLFFSYFARLRNSTKKMMFFYCTKQR